MRRRGCTPRTSACARRRESFSPCGRGSRSASPCSRPERETPASGDHSDPALAKGAGGGTRSFSGCRRPIWMREHATRPCPERERTSLSHPSRRRSARLQGEPGRGPKRASRQAHLNSQVSVSARQDIEGRTLAPHDSPPSLARIVQPHCEERRRHDHIALAHPLLWCPIYERLPLIAVEIKRIVIVLVSA